MNYILKNKYLILTTILVTIFYGWGINNLDAIRQGTEGFYLQVSKEMFEMKSFLVPKYHGEDHWSKPPLHFWLSHIFYFIGGGPSIFLSRLAIVLFSVGTLLLSARQIQKNIKEAKLINIFIFICATVGMFKYSRIFMMEMPLTTLTTLAVLFFFNYLEKGKDLLLAGLFLGLSILVKGPVSFVMALGGVGFYLVILLIRDGFKSEHLKKIIYWSLLGLGIGSIWFIICFIEYGNAFFDYFFLRENLGKFQAKSYPIRHVFQGLIIFSLPWSLYLPTSYAIGKDNFQKLKNDNFLIFCLCNFFVFFTLWLIPSQRSHHYAMPSIIFFLAVNYILLNHYELNAKRMKMLKVANIIISVLVFIFALVLCSLFFFNEVTGSNTLLIKTITMIILLFAGGYLFTRTRKVLSKYIISFFIIGNCWNIFIPSFILPYMPTKVIETIGDKNVGAVVRKPYFIEEAIERKIDWLGPHNIRQYIIENTNYYIVHKSTYDSQQLSNLTDTVTTWKVWKRGAKSKDIIKALKSNDIEQLKDTVYLLKNKPLK